MHLKAVALEDNFGTRGMGDLLEHRLHLGRVKTGLGHENVKGHRQKPEGCRVELARLKERERIPHETQFGDRLTKAMICLILRSTFVR